MNWQEAQKYSPLVLRWGLSFVFVWFGLNQIFSPAAFMGYLPTWAVQDQAGMEHMLYSMASAVPGGARGILLINGIVELILGTLLAMGLCTRVAALLLSLHLLGIVLSLGYNDIAIRDVGLVLATFSIFLAGRDRWCWDYWRKNGSIK